MAKKSARKEITKINLKQAALEGLSYERACETAKRAGKPSYRFTVGDKVQVGHLLNCVVDEALEGGYMYLIRSGANCDDYSCWAWTSVRPLDNGNSTHFAKRNSALSRLHYSNRSMYSLLSFQYLFGVDFNPDYQRGSVWDEKDREKLLDDYSVNLHEWKANRGSCIKLRNGINGNGGTWKGESVTRFDTAENIADRIWSIIKKTNAMS